MTQEQKKCAIYTRKSNEEGLDQDFNSLHAQREAGEAYITSQKSEGWQLVENEYNDGGYSGGDLDRPALKDMIADIKANKIDIIVVYKIDRLTRSLMDFSKLVEVFDEYNVTFISITQSFNTTTSMGRLTLNMLLSFAQFEREVTGERIRDKIAASKKKGMWMGGSPPLGYQLDGGKLIPQPEEIKIVQFIFEEYLKCGAVKKLKDSVDGAGLKTPLRISQKGRSYGGAAFSRGHLYHTLGNPLYIGKIRHKEKLYDGLHGAIIETEIFEKVQHQLKGNSAAKSITWAKSGCLLKGLMYDCDDVIYSPTYTVKNNLRYSYYISQNLIQYRDHPNNVLARIPAHEIEKLIKLALKDWMMGIRGLRRAFPKQPDYYHELMIKNPIPLRRRFILSILQKVTVHSNKLIIEIDPEKLCKEIAVYYEIAFVNLSKSNIKIILPFKVLRANNGAIVLKSNQQNDHDPFNIPTDQLKRVVRGIIWRDEHFAGKTLKNIAAAGGHGENFVNRCIQESFEFPKN
ncbi:MAG: recombinase family protein [Alphaproteobacteria bacterium]|nr:recombinase family protein [Alphaproteobacteria bacterium]